MNANKIILNEEVLIDLTGDTVTEDAVLQGEIFHKADGTQGIGTLALQEKYFTVNGKYGPDEGYAGLSQVTVSIPAYDNTVEVV